jgi:hypothetical protein
METVVPSEEMERRRWIRLARSSTEWAEITASFAMSGLVLADSEDIIAGRLISGAATVDEIVAELKQQYGVAL